MRRTRDQAVFPVLLAGLVVLTACYQVEVAAERSSKTDPDAPTLTAPSRLSLLGKKNIVVTDYQQGMVAVLNKDDLSIKSSFYTNGPPLGVAAYKGLLFVGVESSQDVQVREKSGAWLYDLGDEESPVLHPTDIAVDELNKRVLVVDGTDKAVKVFSMDGPFLFSIPAIYPDKGVLANPTCIAIDPIRLEILVSDYGDPSLYIRPRIQIFSLNGVLIETISGKLGMMGNRFSRPQGLAVDGEGHIFLVDCYSGEVIVIDRDTEKTLATLAGFGDEPGQLQFPLDIVLDGKTKNLYITNNRAGRIEVLENGGVLP